MPEKKVPKSALAFIDRNAYVKFLDTGKPDAPAKLDMVGYSGSVIKDHWYWGDLAIDLAGITASRDRYPILEDHFQDLKIGHSGPPIIDENGLRIDPDDVVLLDNQEANTFVKNSRAGFPYQASIYAIPTQIEYLEAGEEAEVNGYVFAGPGHIWRQCEYQETSACVFGWDKNTRAAAFSDDVIEVEVGPSPVRKRGYDSMSGSDEEHFNQEEAKMPNLFNKKAGSKARDPNRTMTFQEAVSDPAVVAAVKEEIKPEIVEEVKAEVKEEVVAEVKAELEGSQAPTGDMAEGEGEAPPAEDKPEEKKRTLDEARALLDEILKEYPELKSEVTPPKKPEGEGAQMSQKFQRQIDELKNQLSQSNKRLAQSEKSLAIRDAQSAKKLAETILKTKLEASSLPAKFADKVRSMVPHGQFMKDGVLDEAKFSEAVDSEIEDFEDAGGFQVIGGGVTIRSQVPEASQLAEKQEQEDEAWVDKVYKMAVKGGK